MKTWVKVIIIGSIVGLFGYWFVSGMMNQLRDMPQVVNKKWCKKRSSNPVEVRYIKGTEEVVTFFARESASSDRLIARRALLIRRPNAQAMVFVFHGFMCNKYDVRFLANALFGKTINGKPFNVMIIDFRAHGDAVENQCCSMGYNEMYDVIGAVDYIRADSMLKSLPRIAYGFSMGAVSSILAQSHDPTLFDLAIWDCPFESTERLLGRMLDRLKVSAFGYEFPLPGRSLLQKYAYSNSVQSMLKFALKTVAHMDACQVETCIRPVNTVEAMSKIKIPVLMIGCRKDEKAPLSAVKEVYNAACGFKRLWVTNGRNHFDSYFFNPEKYIYKVRSFVYKIMNNKYKSRPQAFIVEDGPED